MKNILLILALINLAACAKMLEPDERLAASDSHLGAPPPADATKVDIPPVVEQVPIIAAPEPAEPLQTFTVVATDLPATELLFALARDARLNLDVDPAIEGNISINAIDQTLPQILKRISRQVALRYYIDGPNLVVEVDRPFTRIYRINYLNMTRNTTSQIDVATQIASTGTVEASGGGGGGSNSQTSVTNDAVNDFWASLEKNIELLANVDDVNGLVITNRESGTISVRTTAAAHEDIQRFVDTVMLSARRQVLIEATVVEVTLNDEYQAGVDWARISADEGWSFVQSTLGETLPNTGPFTEASFFNINDDRTVTGAIRALDTFGDVSVMSSPKIMALNNQTSILKVVDNVVYFETEIDETDGTSNNPPKTTIEVTINTVPVGFVMNVTPFITGDDEVILNIRPTISRVLRFVSTPTIETQSGLTTANEVPEIQVREMESVLRVASGNTAVIGGLMQDTAEEDNRGLPGLHDRKGVGFLFGTKTRDYDKTELVIFLRPRVIANANIDTNLQDFKQYLRPEAFSKQ